MRYTTSLGRRNEVGLNNRTETKMTEARLGRTALVKHGGQGASAASQTRQQTGCEQRERPSRSPADERRERHR